ncbi:hypothetical protein EVAR_80483_1 [Eumeta japonica]|uniref:Uncharacterized protein n=1 Tax=Eumeta variegata TaxID=151549 RepID=A0A4C1ZFW7_EUMVA|nr:hypothetical protein EVAR_80483_1 [Eumeta japonica]
MLFLSIAEKPCFSTKGCTCHEEQETKRHHLENGSVLPGDHKRKRFNHALAQGDRPTTKPTSHESRVTTVTLHYQEIIIVLTRLHL